MGTDNVVQTKSTANQTDPLVNFQVNNPIPPLKRLLKKLFANEEITIKIPILTAIALVAFGLGGASGFLTAIKIELANKIPIIATVFPTPVPTNTPNLWVQTALFGTLTKQTSGNFYLVLDNGDVVRLTVPTNISLEKLSGRKVLASGEYNKEDKEMKVVEASGLRTFTNSMIAPTEKPTSSTSSGDLTPTF